MQKEKTLRFWDDFYLKEKESEESRTSKEWIVQPTQDILESISSHLSEKNKDDDHHEILEHQGLNILEIGCGNSLFSLILWEYLLQTAKTKNVKTRISVTSTDVSSICISHNQERDEDRIKSIALSKGRGSIFRYSILNVIEPNDNDDLLGKHDGILDKGCLDTFLFRSEKSKGDMHPPLLKSLLDNVHSWLKDDGKYIIFSPRSKIKAVRDYRGFSSVKRFKMQCMGDLDGKAKDNETVYMYVCVKCDSYEVGDEPFRDALKVPSDDDKCAICAMTFALFRNGEDVSGKGVKYWSRTWSGHGTHCKAKI